MADLGEGRVVAEYVDTGGRRGAPLASDGKLFPDRALGDGTLDQREQRVDVHRLLQELIRSRSNSLYRALHRRVRGDDDDRKTAVRLPNTSHELDPVHAGHGEIRDEGVDAATRQARERLLPGTDDLGRRLPWQVEVRLHESREQSVVVRDQQRERNTRGRHRDGVRPYVLHAALRHPDLRGETNWGLALSGSMCRA